MKHPFRIALALLLGCSALSAQQTVRAAWPDPELDALVAEALKNAPEAGSARAAVEAARYRIVPAATLPDPFVSTTYQNDGRSFSLGEVEGSFLGLMASQPLPWPGKLSLAGKAAASEAREVESGLAGRTMLTLEARLRNAWYDLALALAIDRILDDRRSAASRIETAVRERYAAGLAVQQDVLRAQIEVARIEEAKAAQAAVIAAKTAELNRLSGRPQTAEIGTAATLPETGPLPAADTLIAAAMSRSPELAAAQQSVETGRIRAGLARKNFLPDFVVSAGSMYRAGFAMGPMWQVALGVSIPLWIERRQQNQLAEAEALVTARSADAVALAREIELRTRERIAQLEAADRVAALYRERILPLDELSLESALASYQAGKVPFVTVLDALAALFNDRAARASRLAESAKWRVAIDEASLQPTAMSGSPAMPGGMTPMSGQNAGERTPANGTASMPSMR
ncbi:MAG TPA: TolC family protein [Thermoanaerobaculia bacterium]|nr:TolC family protein [Thermoanaerobaculia bacterium]